MVDTKNPKPYREPVTTITPVCHGSWPGSHKPSETKAGEGGSKSK